MLTKETAVSEPGRRCAGDATDVWIIPLANSLASAQACLSWMDKHELARMLSLSFVVDRILYVESHAWLRRILSEYTGIPPGVLRFSRSQAGKPMLELPTQENMPLMHFSLSHTPGCVAIAISEQCEVGVDIERVRYVDMVDAINRMVLHRDEHVWLDDLPPDEKNRSFFRLWTAKEAYMKALGHDLAHPFDRLSVRFLDGSLCEIGDGSIESAAQARRYCSMLISPGSSLDEFAFAVASTSGSRPVVLHSVAPGCKPTEPSIGAGCREIEAH